MSTNEKKDFPGYPHYPASEDITRKDNNNGQESIDPSGDSPTNSVTPDTKNTPTSDSDISREELDLLDSSEEDGEETQQIRNSSLDSTDGDGYLLNEVSGLFSSDRADDLDVPGSEDDDTDEDAGEEDEENNYYSLGGDDQENQEENKGE